MHPVHAGRAKRETATRFGSLDRGSLDLSSISSPILFGGETCFGRGAADRRYLEDAAAPLVPVQNRHKKSRPLQQSWLVVFSWGITLPIYRPRSARKKSLETADHVCDQLKRNLHGEPDQDRDDLHHQQQLKGIGKTTEEVDQVVIMRRGATQEPAQLNG